MQKLLPGFAGSAVLDADGLNAAAQLLAEGKTLPHPAGELIVTRTPARWPGSPGFRWRRSMRTVKILPASMQKNGTLWWYSRAAVPWWLHRMAACAQTLPETQALPRRRQQDVLAGMTAALLACGLPAYEAAACAVYLHGAAADRAAAARGDAEC